MHKILVVDDEADIREVVKEYAQVNDIACDEADDGLKALDMVAMNHYDCIILDVMMPYLDGFSACRKIKQIQDVPIIILSARSEEYDKLFGFELGVDDYVVKPFSPKELLARVKVVIERNTPHNAKAVVFDGVKVDIVGRSVTVDGQLQQMTPKEIDLLIYLVTHPGVAFSREHLLRDVWDTEYYGDDRTVDSHIRMLRSHLGNYRDKVVTVRGMGYKFEG